MLIYGSVVTPNPFSFSGDTLTINTTMMTLKFQKGAVVGVVDSVNVATLLDTDITTNPPASWIDFLGLGIASRDVNDYHGAIIPDTEVAYTKVDTYTATLAYTNCMWVDWYTISGANITYTFVVDPVTGEVSISCTGVFPDSSVPYATYGEKADSISIPVMNFGATGTGTIVGPQRLAFADASVDIMYTGAYSQNNSPPLFVCEGSSCFAAWSENDKILKDVVNTYHTQSSHDHIVMHCPFDPKVQVSDAFTCTGGPWRFTVQNTWLDVVKRWRARYEAMTPDIEYLWNKSPVWVQDIHCRYGMPHPVDYATDYPTLITAAGGTAANILCDSYGVEWNGNGDGMILYGQIDPVTTNTWPTAGEQSELETQGLRSVGYWYWMVMAHDPNAMITDRGANVPADWSSGWNNGVAPTTFNPDYTGAKTDAAWQAYWSDVIVPAGATYKSIIHPAASKFLTTQLQIARDWCAKFNHSGLFWDVTWDDQDSAFVGSSLRITNNKDFLNGELAVAKAFVESGSGYIIVCEHFDHRFMPYTFMAFEGAQEWENIAVNHPLRQALIASYMWSKDYKLADTPKNNIDDYSQEHFAYLGCIPALTLSDDYNAPTFGNDYYNARAKMFCDYEMFYDLPTTWAANTLAYYRCNIGGGVQIKFLKRATGRYAYMRSDNGAVILQHELKTGVSITDTLAITYADTYGSAPTVLVDTAGYSITDPTTTGCTINLAGTHTIAWLAFGA